MYFTQISIGSSFRKGYRRACPAILYRLKMTDRDQPFAYSRIVSVGFDNRPRAILYPNPVSEQLHLNAPDLNAVRKIGIYNFSGTRVYTSGKMISKIIPVKDLPVGMYIVSVTGQDGSYKILVSR